MRTKLFVILYAVFSLAIYSQTNNQQLARQIIEEKEAVDAALPQINVLIKKGEKAQAKGMTENALKQIEDLILSHKRLTQLEESELGEVPSLVDIQEIKLYLIKKLNQLRYTNIYIQCEAELFSNDYSLFCEEVRTHLSDESISFVESADASDWAITIQSKAREHNKSDFGNMSSYTAYVDVRIIVVKEANGKRIIDKTISEKGVSPFGFDQAAQDGYKKISPKISSIIREQIEQ